MRKPIIILIVALIAALGWWWASNSRNQSTTASISSLLLPNLQTQLNEISNVEIIGAGNKTQVLLKRDNNQWQVAQRQWPANAAALREVLLQLAQAKKIEEKTADPNRHAKLGVEDIAADDAKSVKLSISFADSNKKPILLIIGNPWTDRGQYVRLADQKQSWLIDTALTIERDPSKWLSSELIDVPLARVEAVEVKPEKNAAFKFSRSDERFVLDGAPSGALAQSSAPQALAGFLEQLTLEDVLEDSKKTVEQTVTYALVDGRKIIIEAWRDQQQTWARLRAELDEVRADQWLKNQATVATEKSEKTDSESNADNNENDISNADEEKTMSAIASIDDLRQQITDQNARWKDRQFLLPGFKATSLMRDKAEYLSQDP